MLRSRRGVQITLEEMTPDVSDGKTVLRIGAPASFEGIGRALSINDLVVIVALFPMTVVAGFRIGIRVFSVIVLHAIAVARGVETMTGQTIGAGNDERAPRTNHVGAMKLFVLFSVLGVIGWVNAGSTGGVFSDESAQLT